MLTAEKITKFVPMIDAKYVHESKTAVLDTPNELIGEYDGCKTVKIAKIATEGLADYNKKDGFANGDVTLDWESFTLEQDRGKSFNIDYVDNDEVDGLAVASVLSTFMTESVVPEVDAYRFAKYFANKGYEVDDAELDKDTVCDALDEAEVAFDEAGVPTNDSYFFMSARVYSYVKKSDAWARTLIPSENPNRNYGTYDEIPVVKVPRNRFVTQIEMTDKGYKIADGAKDINFMLIHPQAVVQVVKHEKIRVFDPDTNQDADAYKIDYRIHHDVFVPDNKKVAIYGHAKPIGE